MILEVVVPLFMVTLIPASGPEKLLAIEAVDTRVMHNSDVLNKVFIKLFPFVKRNYFLVNVYLNQLIKYSHLDKLSEIYIVIV